MPSLAALRDQLDAAEAAEALKQGNGKAPPIIVSVPRYKPLEIKPMPQPITVRVR